jgi:pSer/pThr/pTyr-binding forkhead associated (FHA) protein
MTSGADAWLVDERWFKAYPIVGDTTIGRSAKCTIILRDPAVSRVHAEVVRRPSGYVVIAHANTTLNGMAVEGETLLKEGDVIDIEVTSLRFTMSAPTGEMFLVSRDYPTPKDREEAPTRPTLHAMHPITIASRVPVLWRRVLIVVLLVALLAFLLASVS